MAATCSTASGAGAGAGSLSARAWRTGATTAASTRPRRPARPSSCSDMRGSVSALRRRRLCGGDAAGDEAVGRVRAGGVCRRVGDLRAFGQHGLQRHGGLVWLSWAANRPPLQAVDVFGNGPAEQVDQLGIGPHAVAQHHHLPLAQAQQITLQQRGPAFFGLDVNHGIGLTPSNGCRIIATHLDTAPTPARMVNPCASQAPNS